MTTPAVITGAAGWLGQGLVRAIANGLPEVPGLESRGDRPLRCLVHAKEDVAVVKAIAPQATVIVGDVSTAESLEPLFAGLSEGATVFHTAGVIHPRRVKEFYTVNENGTKNVVAWAEKSQCRRLVHVSSNSPLGTNSSPDDVFDENAPYHPYMNYGKSKMLAENHALAANGTDGLSTVVIRPPWFYGPGQPARQSEFFRMIKNGKAPLVGSGKNRRSMAYVDNICQGALLAEKTASAAGQCYWIADKRPYPMTEVIETIRLVLSEDFGMEVRTGAMKLPGFASGIAYGVDACLQAVGLYHTKIHVLSEMNKTIACSVAKAEKELGYAPHIELREGMRRSVQDLLDRGVSLG